MSGLSGFKSVRLAGTVTPADALTRAADGAMPGQTPADYGLVGTLTINAAAARAWDVLLPAHQAWKAGLARLDGRDAATGYTREKWLLPLLYELGYGRPTPLHAGLDLPPGLGETKPAHFTLSHQLTWPADTAPTAALAIHLLGPAVDLERKTPGVTARAPHAMLQDLLNRSPVHLWALLSNGTTLRVLRDASSLARQSYLEFDLDLIFDNQLFADFRLLFTILHATRFTPRDRGDPSPSVAVDGHNIAAATDDSADEPVPDIEPTGPTTGRLLVRGLARHCDKRRRSCARRPPRRCRRRAHRARHRVCYSPGERCARPDPRHQPRRNYRPPPLAAAHRLPVHRLVRR
jgi:hypothetical protein